jgi:hypothetical protein
MKNDRGMKESKYLSSGKYCPELVISTLSVPDITLTIPTIHVKHYLIHTKSQGFGIRGCLRLSISFICLFSLLLASFGMDFPTCFDILIFHGWFSLTHFMSPFYVSKLSIRRVMRGDT